MTRKAVLFFFALVLIVILLPALVVSLGLTKELSPEDDGCPRGRTESKGEAGIQLHFYRNDRQEVVVMELEKYLEGVLLAEMPSSFEMEALKAQAVVARTYALHQMRSLGGGGCGISPHPADICSDSTHCQAWKDPAEAVAEWGSEGKAFLERIRQAIAETAGEAVCYQGKLIEAVYHSTCGGRTEASHALWNGGPLPYLQSIDCPYCKHSPHYREQILIPFTELAASLHQDLAMPAASGSRPPLEVASETPGERIATLRVNGTFMEGKELRRLLGLPSTALSWEVKDDGLLVYARGRGHGVGLCQYGADGAAREGKSYLQIILFYYPGSEVIKFIP